MKPLHIAIDGPAGAGKSTIAKALAQRLDIAYVDTGAMYRGITLKALRSGIDLADETQFDFVEKTDFKYTDKRLMMDGEMIEEAVRDQTINEWVSLVAAHAKVRESLVRLQQHIAQDTPCVMDGRDIGTHVLPKATFKFFLTADVTTRAQRRLKDLNDRGKTLDLNYIIEDIKRRDHIDSTRKLNPLVAAQDAIHVDTSHLSIEEVIETLERQIREDESVWS